MYVFVPLYPSFKVKVVFPENFTSISFVGRRAGLKVFTHPPADVGCLIHPVFPDNS